MRQAGERRKYTHIQREQNDGLVQERRNSIANAMELRLFLQ